MNLRLILKWVAAAGDPDVLQKLVLEEITDVEVFGPDVEGLVLNARAIVKDDDAWAFDYETARGLFEGIAEPPPGVVQGDFLDWFKENWQDVLAALLDLFADGDVAKFQGKYGPQLPNFMQLSNAMTAVETSENATELLVDAVEMGLGEKSGIAARAQAICDEVADEAEIDPATIIILVELAIKLIEWWRNRDK